MKPGGGKRKGNGYEIKISRILSEWYVKNFRRINEVKNKQDYFWRTAGSGAKATVTRRGETSFVGDIAFLPEPDRLKIWIDTKDTKKATFNDMLKSTKQFIVWEWYMNEVYKRDKLKVKKPVVIIFKFYKKKEDYIFYDRSSFVPFPFFEWTSYLDWGDFRIMRLDVFLEHVKKESILSDS